MSFLRFTVLALAMLCVVDAQSIKNVFIQSKLDGEVLEVVYERATYDRQGVILYPNNWNRREQMWNILIDSSPQYARFESHNGPMAKNTISTGQKDENSPEYTHFYDITNVTFNSYGILQWNDGDSNPRLCIKHPGYSGQHLEVECDSNDDAQLWKLIQR